MKNADIKKMLADGRNSVMPDREIKNRIKNELGIADAPSSSLAYAHGGTKTGGGRRKAWIIAAAAAVIAAIVLCTVIPLSLRGGGPAGTLPPANKFARITDAESFYAYGAASVGALLSDSEIAAVSAAARTGASSTAGTESDAAETANRYMALVESLLGAGEITETVTQGTGEYEYAMTVSYTDLLGAKIEYTMNYDKTPLGYESEDGETEEEYAIDGELVIGADVYPVTGIYETETEDDETSSTMEFRAYTSADRSSYISVEHETESETEDGENETETEYVYTVVENGERVEQTHVGYETENDELELEMRVVGRDGREDTLLFSDETEDGERVLSVRGDINGERVFFRIYVRNGEYHYVFADGEEDFDR